MFSSLAYPELVKQLKLHKINAPPNVDGVIDPVWAQADSATDFVQYRPYFDKEPNRRTVARLLTTDQSLYCMIVCYDQRKNIQQNTGLHDDFGGDVVSLMLDTFGDKQTAYKFAVTASGIRGDSRLLDDARNRDYSWDGVWFANTRVYDWGYVVEMEIPYRSIQYDERRQTWGLDFDRWIPALTEDIYWNRYEENEGQRISKFGNLLFDDFHPTVKGSNLEFYPVGLTKATYVRPGAYNVDPTAGIDIFYNPSPQLTFQLTGNPDFAQIEADPFAFNISRYETFFEERRPFFTQGREIFMASGRQQNTGFYRPLELFYSRRIGKVLPDGREVPLHIGSKASGRIDDWEYGGFVATTGETEYVEDDERKKELQAGFTSLRVKKQIFGNSSVGLLFVGKHDRENNDGVIDVDGAFRTSHWQLAYQLARSFKNSSGGYAMSVGFTSFADNWMTLVRTRYIGEEFDLDQIGFVPWKGTAEITGVAGPRWYFEDGYISQILLYGGGALNYEKVDHYTDHEIALGFNMQFRDSWGYEINVNFGKTKDEGIEYKSLSISLSSWFSTSPNWNGNLWGGYSRTYNFSREYVAFYSWGGIDFNWLATSILQVGTSLNTFIEGNPSGSTEDVTLNARPYFSLTPLNDLNLRVYVDNVFLRSSERNEQVLFGLLFSYQFMPKSWIYFALNELHNRGDEFDSNDVPLPHRLHVADRVAVAKVKYLYYF